MPEIPAVGQAVADRVPAWELGKVNAVSPELKPANAAGALVCAHGEIDERDVCAAGEHEFAA